jgi:hypothetical protein
MPEFQVHRLRDAQRQQFRSAPHTSGVSIVKPKDYEKREVVEAGSPYDVWDRFRKTDHPLEVGDILEISGGELRICKYIGFEEARWFVPESAVTGTSVPEAAPAASPDLVGHVVT